MKLNVLMILCLVLSLTACGKPKLTAEQQSAIRHMHLHAQQLRRLNDALAQDDLDAAQTPAYWLSRHKEVSAFPEDLRPHRRKMRISAQDVEAAPDLEAARAAAQRVAESCLECHAAGGYDIDITRMQRR